MSSSRLSTACRPAVATVLAGCLFLALPAAAAAHGLSVDDDPNRPLIQYVVLGFEHMALGWDHLLFIIGCVLLAPTVGMAAKLITLFVLGHSLTLLVATLAGWKVNVTLVDVAIAFSVVFIGALGVWRRPLNWRLVGAIVFGFGLVHGLGLSTRLQGIALPEDGLALRIIAFNVGIELGQLAVLAVVVVLWKGLTRLVRQPRVAERAVFGAMVVAGLAAALILPFTAETEPAVAAGTSCVEANSAPPAPGGGGHPPKRFYGPGEEAPGEDMAHVLFDGWVVITYRADLPAASRKALERWVLGKDQAVVAAAARGQAPAVRARTIRSELTCSTFELTPVIRFREAWVG